MRLTNYTNIPTEEIRKIIAAVRPPGISKFEVDVKNHGGMRGRGVAYTQGVGYDGLRSNIPLIIVSIAKTEEKARYIMPARGAYLPGVTGSRREVLVKIMAHELRHLWQAKHRRGRVWGARGKFSERDADAYALQMLRKYRRGELAGI